MRHEGTSTHMLSEGAVLDEVQVKLSHAHHLPLLRHTKAVI
jgi:hypothetical protein